MLQLSHSPHRRFDHLVISLTLSLALCVSFVFFIINIERNQRDLTPSASQSFHSYFFFMFTAVSSFSKLCLQQFFGLPISLLPSVFPTLAYRFSFCQCADILSLFPVSIPKYFEFYKSSLISSFRSLSLRIVLTVVLRISLHTLCFVTFSLFLFTSRLLYELSSLYFASHLPFLIYL